MRKNIKKVLIVGIAAIVISTGASAQDTPKFPVETIDKAIINQRGLQEKVRMLTEDCNWSERIGEKIDVFWLQTKNGNFFGYSYEYFMDCDNVRLIYQYNNPGGTGRPVDFMIENLEDESRFVVEKQRHLKNIKKYRHLLKKKQMPLENQITNAQNIDVEIPDFNDEYCQTINKLESGETEIDYLKFRESFLDSKQFKIAGEKSEEFSNLEKKMYEQIDSSEYQEIIKTTKKMLSIDYTNMKAHKILRQTYKILGDKKNAKKYKEIQFGLLYSIIRNRNGKSCETAWPVIQISEEYFILEMMDAKLISQTINNEDGICDEMKVKAKNKEMIYFFDTSRIFEQYSKMGKKEDKK